MTAKRKAAKAKPVQNALKLKPRTESIVVAHPTKWDRVPTGKAGAKRFRTSIG